MYKVFLLFFLPLFANAQELNFINYSTKDGLSSSEVYDIYQDVNGLMWFATDAGISSYNGYEFKTFGLEDGLTGLTVFDFVPQENGDIWCLTWSNKFFKFNPNNYIFSEYKYNTALAKCSGAGVPQSLMIDENGTINVGYNGRFGITSIDTKGEILSSSRAMHADDSSTQGLIIAEKEINGNFLFYVEELDSIVNIDQGLTATGEVRYSNYCSRQNTLAILTMWNEAHLFDKQDHIQVINIGKRIIGTGFLNDDTFWIGYKTGGFSTYDSKGNLKRSYLLDENVSDVFIDYNGGLWVSTTSSGVYYAKNSIVQNYPVLGSSRVTDLLTDQKGNLQVELKNRSEYIFRPNEIFEKQKDIDLIEIGVNEPLNYEDLLRYKTRELHVLENTPLIIAGDFIRLYNNEEGGYLSTRHDIYFIDSKGKLKSYMINGHGLDGFQPTKNGLYIGLYDGLYLYDTLKGTKKKIQLESLNIRITDIKKFRKYYAIGTKGKGLVLFDGKKAIPILKKDGLSGNFLREIYVEDQSTLWVCSNSGLNRIKFDESGAYSIRKITTLDGLLDNDVRDVQVIDDIVWVGTGSGLCSFSKELLNLKKTRKFFLKVLHKQVNDEEVVKLDDLSYWQNKIKIRYEAIAFSGKIKYRYKLSGLNENWTYTFDRQVIFESIPPGAYTFILQCALVDEDWGKSEIRCAIVISPPYYETLWFRSGILLLISLIIYLFFKFRILSYNRALVKEILRHLLKKVKKKSNHFIIRENGKDVKISSNDVLFVKSSGNYLEIHTDKNVHLIREKLSNFTTLVADPIEYVQLQRSHIVRIDKITAKSINTISIGDTEIKVGHTYLKKLKEINL
ncbi:MAG: LytTR family transcriptional regulator DNA-binding domain-containing protein [Crocinitomicaceae bacterium]|nr:LytTR family transcriptional regulator DNA-binding domain-containing protein [Crocinitomicaceae bacterium]